MRDRSVWSRGGSEEIRVLGSGGGMSSGAGDPVGVVEASGSGAVQLAGTGGIAGTCGDQAAAGTGTGGVMFCIGVCEAEVDRVSSRAKELQAGCCSGATQAGVGGAPGGRGETTACGLDAGATSRGALRQPCTAHPWCSCQQSRWYPAEQVGHGIAASTFVWQYGQ